MKAMISAAPGGPETLELTETPTPTPGPNQVLIAVEAIGVNFPDTLIIKDLYQFKPPRPFAPGSEVSGVVEAVGEKVTAIKPGDRVLAMGAFGGYATHFIAEQNSTAVIPDAMPFDEAAAFIFTYGTSYYGLVHRGEMKAGDTVLILGAAGGVGAAGIEIAKAKGARVIAAVSSEEKAAFCKELGADETVVYASGEMDRDAQKAFSGALKSLGGADIVYDCVGGGYAEPAIRALNWEGRFLVVGFPAGIPKIPLNLTLLKSCQVVGVFWGAAIQRDPKLLASDLAALFELYNEGKVRPPVTERLPLQDAAQALNLLSDRKARGKVVLVTK